MQQPQFYKTVRASERLPELKGEQNKYIVILDDGYVTDAFLNYDKDNPEFFVIKDEKSLLTNKLHWLEPIPIPDAEVLREALSDISEMIDTNRQPSLNQIRAIALESLSNTSDGWVRVDSGKLPPETDKHYYWLHSEKHGSYNIGEYDYSSKCFRDQSGMQLFFVSHWQTPRPPHQ